MGKPAGGKLTNKQQRFVEEYMIDLNATQAAIRAGYSVKTAQRIGSENLLKLVIQSKIQELRTKQQARTQISADWVLKEIHRIASFDVRKMYDEYGKLIPVHMLDDDTAAAISGLDVVQSVDGEGGSETVKKYKISDKNTALEKLAKHFDLYGERGTNTVSPKDMAAQIRSFALDLESTVPHAAK